jgi:hypothetical protein
MKYFIVALISVSTAALAQQSKPVWTVHNLQERYDADTDLGKAMNVCADHRHFAPSTRPGNVAVDYDDGWEGCNAVHARWQKSKEAQDKEFIEKVGKDAEHK